MFLYFDVETGIVNTCPWCLGSVSCLPDLNLSDGYEFITTVKEIVLPDHLLKSDFPRIFVYRVVCCASETVVLYYLCENDTFRFFPYLCWGCLLIVVHCHYLSTSCPVYSKQPSGAINST